MAIKENGRRSSNTMMRDELGQTAVAMDDGRWKIDAAASTARLAAASMPRAKSLGRSYTCFVIAVHVTLEHHA